MRRVSITGATVADAVAELRPSAEDREDLRRAVADIVAAVRSAGDEALLRLTARLDGVEPPSLRVAPADVSLALDVLAPAVREALELAIDNVRQVSEALMPAPVSITLDQGHTVAVRPSPVDRAGVYVPGGRAAYPSSAVMAIVPAVVAGVRQIAVCTPPGDTGLPHPSILAACALLGVDEVYAVGGAQAVAAMALGTDTIARVDMLVGPGNAYVEEAKRLLWGDVGIESLAGPSELIVVADGTAPTEAIAWDLLAQAEHGAGSQSVLVSDEPAVLDAVAAALAGEAAANVTLGEVDSVATAIGFVNAYAPEHLQLCVAEPRALLDDVRHAGAIFLGATSATAFGDYVAGSNHVLPTCGRARFSSGLGPAAYLRMQEIVEVPAAAASTLARPLAALAHAEGFGAHARSALARADNLSRLRLLSGS